MRAYYSEAAESQKQKESQKQSEYEVGSGGWRSIVVQRMTIKLGVYFSTLAIKNTIQCNDIVLISKSKMPI